MKKRILISLLITLTLIATCVVLARFPGLEPTGTENFVTYSLPTNNLDMGNYSVLANTFTSTVSTGTAPFTVSSTTKVANLNADAVDGVSIASGTLLANYLQAIGTDLGDADITIDLSNTNTGNVTNITTDGVATLNLSYKTIVTNTSGAETLTAAQSGSLVVATKSDGATTVTIPDPSSATIGVVYYLLQTEDQNLVVTCTSADNNAIVCDGVATSDNVTISTASHKIGAGMLVVGISATKWYVGGLNPESLLTPEAAD